MSGLFRYLLRASYAPGTDVVAALQGLYTTSHILPLLQSTAITTTQCQHQQDPWSDRGVLFNCDVVVSGEGSFDTQTIASHKTVGRMLELCVLTNAEKLAAFYRCSNTTTTPPSLSVPHEPRFIREFVVLCGRCGFSNYDACQQQVYDTLRETLLGPSTPDRSGSSAAPVSPSSLRSSADADLLNDLRQLSTHIDVLRQCPSFIAWVFRNTAGPPPSHLSAAEVLRLGCMPQLTVLPLTPEMVTLSSAMEDTYDSIVACVAHTLELTSCLLQSSEK